MILRQGKEGEGICLCIPTHCNLLVLVLSVLTAVCNLLTNSSPQVKQVCGLFLSLLFSNPWEGEATARLLRQGWMWWQGRWTPVGMMYKTFSSELSGLPSRILVLVEAVLPKMLQCRPWGSWLLLNEACSPGPLKEPVSAPRFKGVLAGSISPIRKYGPWSKW